MPIETRNISPRHPDKTAALKGQLETVSEEHGSSRRIMPVIEFMQQFTPGAPDKLALPETKLILSERYGLIRAGTLAEVNVHLNRAGANIQILGVHEVGNKFQTVTNVMRDVDDKAQRNFPQGSPVDEKTGFPPPGTVGKDGEQIVTPYPRPIVNEGDHTVGVITSTDSNGQTYIYRTIQIRADGEASVDTVRGFLPKVHGEDGVAVYDVANAEPQIDKSLNGIRKTVKEEAGEHIQVESITYLGAHVTNKTMTTKPGAYFAIGINHDSMQQSPNVMNPAELKRQQEQLMHQGLTEVILRFTPEEYADYLSDPEISRDLTADAPSDVVVINALVDSLHGQKKQIDQLERAAERELLFNAIAESNLSDEPSYDEYLTVREHVPTILDVAAEDPKTIFRKRLPTS